MDVCFFNTFSEILSDNWLRKMAEHYRRPGVGAVGFTGSYESLDTSNSLINKVVWLANSGRVRFNRQIADQFRSILLQNVPFWVSVKSQRRWIIEAPTHSIVSGFQGW
jgi:hypothetical protein